MKAASVAPVRESTKDVDPCLRSTAEFHPTRLLSVANDIFQTHSPHQTFSGEPRKSAVFRASNVVATMPRQAAIRRLCNGTLTLCLRHIAITRSHDKTVDCFTSVTTTVVCFVTTIRLCCVMASTIIVILVGPKKDQKLDANDESSRAAAGE